MEQVMVLEEKKLDSDVWELNHIYTDDKLNHDWEHLNNMADTQTVFRGIFGRSEFRVVRFLREQVPGLQDKDYIERLQEIYNEFKLGRSADPDDKGFDAAALKWAIERLMRRD